MRKLEKIINQFAKLTARNFGLGKNLDEDTDDYIDYFG